MEIWQALTIAVVPTIIMVASNWGLKLYELKRAIENPAQMPEANKDAQIKKTKRLRRTSILLVIGTLLISISELIFTLSHSPDKSTLTALVIAVDVSAVLCTFLGIMWVNIFLDHSRRVFSILKTLNSEIQAVKSAQEQMKSEKGKNQIRTLSPFPMSKTEVLRCGECKLFSFSRSFCHQLHIDLLVPS